MMPSACGPARPCLRCGLAGSSLMLRIRNGPQQAASPQRQARTSGLTSGFPARPCLALRTRGFIAYTAYRSAMGRSRPRVRSGQARTSGLTSGFRAPAASDAHDARRRCPVPASLRRNRSAAIVKNGVGSFIDIGAEPGRSAMRSRAMLLVLVGCAGCSSSTPPVPDVVQIASIKLDIRAFPRRSVATTRASRS